MLRATQLIGFGGYTASVSAGTWTPTDAAAGGPAVWHDILDAATLTLVSTAISGWANKGSLGSSYDVAQGTSGARPTLSGTVGVAGSYASFDGGDSLASSSSVSMFSGGSSVTMALLYETTAAAIGGIFGQDGTTRLAFTPRYSLDSNTYVDLSNTSTARMSANLSGATVGAARHVLVAWRSGANMALYLDGNQTASITTSGASGTTSGTTPYRIGGIDGNLPSGTKVYEAIGWNAALSTADMDRVAAYMAWRHGEQAILHASNPYTAAAP